ncbi:MAG: hypothetical protein ACLFUY_01575 [Desulfobacterales bacterium]
MKLFIWPFLLCLVLLAACAGRQLPGVTSQLSAPDSARMLRTVKAKNAELAPYKGIGRIGIQNSGNSWGVGAAWVAAPDGRLRVAALSLTGQAFARMICDPRKCYFIFRSADEGCLRRETPGDRSLEPLVGINLAAGDLVRLLGGGAPLVDYDSAEAYDMDSGEKLVVLKKRFFGTVETIRFSPDMAHVREVTVYGWRGADYRAKITHRQQVNGQSMPFALQISDESGSRMRVSVERCWINIKPSAEAFSTDLPEGARCD